MSDPGTTAAAAAAHSDHQPPRTRWRLGGGGPYRLKRSRSNEEEASTTEGMIENMNVPRWQRRRRRRSMIHSNGVNSETECDPAAAETTTRPSPAVRHHPRFRRRGRGGGGNDGIGHVVPAGAAHLSDSNPHTPAIAPSPLKKGLFARQRQKRAERRLRKQQSREMTRGGGGGGVGEDVEEEDIYSPEDSSNDGGDFYGVGPTSSADDHTFILDTTMDTNNNNATTTQQRRIRFQEEGQKNQPLTTADENTASDGAPAALRDRTMSDSIYQCENRRRFRKGVAFDMPPINDRNNRHRMTRSDMLVDYDLNGRSQAAGGREKDDDADDPNEQLTASWAYFNKNDHPPATPPPSLSMSSRALLSPRHELPREQQRARYHSRGGGKYQVGNPAKKKFRVRPFHCFPDRPQYMTEEEIYTDSLKPSKHFVPLRSYLAPTAASPTTSRPAKVPEAVQRLWGSPEEDGRIGALRVEVLGCVSLNRTKPDVLVYCVCGDSAFCTDVLNGYRSPMWPSISRRACAIPIHHAYAKLYVGVFDARVRKNKGNDVFCGRVVVDIASLRPDTEYDATMPLRVSAFVYDKRKHGVVRLRFSLHWFSERAAVLSYFKSVRSLVDSCPLVEGQPTIPCADPKTFRNVAVTVYGQDLPGKYSRSAFRATVREFSLYQQNLRFVVRTLVLDAMLYEQPWFSLYLFGAAMFCVLSNSVKMVPAFFVGYLLILYIENYRHFVEDRKISLGYKPLTIGEVFKALVVNSQRYGESGKSMFEPISVQKRTKRRRDIFGAKLKRWGSNEEEETGAAEDCDAMEDFKAFDHREFPFSDRDAYPNRCVEDALAPGSSKGGTGHLHGRLSIYYTAEPPVSFGDSGSMDGEDEDDSELESDRERDDETIMTESQMIGDNMFDLACDGEDEDEETVEGDFNYSRAKMLQSGHATAKRRVRLGPPQDNDVLGRKVPPQLQLRKTENMLHRISRSVSVELVHAPPSTRTSANVDNPSLIMSTGIADQASESQASVPKRARKIPYDDFDKLLGLQTRSANPVNRIMSSFIGPIMRMIRVTIYLVRIAFNVTTWKDPYLSFWVLVMLICLFLILAIFPWRTFFCVSSALCLGPQNLFFRKYLEKKNAEREQDDLEDGARLNGNGDSTTMQRSDGGRSLRLDTSSRILGNNVNERTRRSFFAKRRKDNGRSPRGAAMKRNAIENEIREKERPAFQSALNRQTGTNKKVEPRAVAIPYSCLKKDRFYDWPPDPTVSRATPVVIQKQPLGIDDFDDSLTASVPEYTLPDQDDDFPSTFRRRHGASQNSAPHDIPSNIAF